MSNLHKLQIHLNCADWMVYGYDDDVYMDVLALTGYCR